MISIVRATINHADLLAHLAKLSFLQSHGHSAPAKDIDDYIRKNYSTDIFTAELNDTKNIYHIIYHNDQAAGYSKIIFNTSYDGKKENIAKLERIYLLEEFYSLQLGLRLFEYNKELCKQNDQTGMWLFVWKENPRAVNFYKKNGFRIIGSHDFRISETHSNPNYQMLLEF